MNEDRIRILPIDGYFWIERDGRVIDFHFKKEEQMILNVFDCIYKRHYKEAPELVQKVYIGMLLKAFDGIIDMTTEEETQKFIKKWKPEFNKQCINVYVEWKLRGGEIKFGSKGYQKKNTNKIHWEYGHENYNSVKHYNYKNYIKV